MLRQLTNWLHRREIPAEGSCRARIAEYVTALRCCWDRATNRRLKQAHRDFQIHKMRQIVKELLRELGG